MTYIAKHAFILITLASSTLGLGMGISGIYQISQCETHTASPLDQTVNTDDHRYQDRIWTDQHIIDDSKVGGLI